MLNLNPFENKLYSLQEVSAFMPAPTTVSIESHDYDGYNRQFSIDESLEAINAREMREINVRTAQEDYEHDLADTHYLYDSEKELVQLY